MKTFEAPDIICVTLGDACTRKSHKNEVNRLCVVSFPLLENSDSLLVQKVEVSETWILFSVGDRSLFNRRLDNEGHHYNKLSSHDGMDLSSPS